MVQECEQVVKYSAAKERMLEETINFFLYLASSLMVSTIFPYLLAKKKKKGKKVSHFEWIFNTKHR